MPIQPGIYLPNAAGTSWVLLGQGFVPGDTVPPTTPAPLTVVSKTASSMTYAWQASTDASGIKRYEMQQGPAPLSASAPWTPLGLTLGRTVSSLSELTSYTARVRSIDNADNASAAATVTDSTPAGSSGSGLVATLMGVSDSGADHGYANWDAWRIYKYSAVASAVSRGAKVVALTDTGAGSYTGGAAAANALRTFLMGFYGKIGTPSQNATIQIHFANGNEIDNKNPNLLQLANTFELMEAVIADFPLASLWFDATQHQIDIGNTPAIINAAASSGRKVYQMLDGLAGSYYPPRRGDYPNITLASYTAANSTAETVVGLFMNLLASLGAGSKPTRMAIWEIGFPAAITPPPPITSGSGGAYTGSGSTLNNAHRRGDYLHDFLFYWFDQCLANGLTPEVACYWDQQTLPQGATYVRGSVSAGTNGGPDNRWLNDGFNNPGPPWYSATLWRNAPADYNNQ